MVGVHCRRERNGFGIDLHVHFENIPIIVVWEQLRSILALGLVASGTKKQLGKISPVPLGGNKHSFNFK